MKHAFLWYTCREDFDCLILSIRSARKACPESSFFYVADRRGFTDFETAELVRLGAIGIEADYSGMVGAENIAKMVNILADLAKDFDYITKIDSDVLVCNRGWMRYLDGRFVTVGTKGACGGLMGAIYSVRADAAMWIASRAKDVDAFNSWLIALTRNPILQEDFAITMGIQAEFEEWHVAEMMDGQSGFVGHYRPSDQFEELAARFDAIHFGNRRAARAKAGIRAVGGSKPRCADQIRDWMKDCWNGIADRH